MTSKEEKSFPIDYTIDIPPDYLPYFSIAIRLPREDWKEYWDKIFVDQKIKERLMNYLKALYIIQNKKISDVSLAFHKLILLYGPPGTGKTTLARGLANKFAENLYKEYKQKEIYFFEISAPSVLSKYLGETPKFINIAFSFLNDFATDRKQVVVLVDEIESLMVNRSYAISEVNPLDVFRGINEALNQIDLLSKNTNMYIITTSNYPDVLDEAFIDRIDLLIRIDLPNDEMRRLIIEDSLNAVSKILGTNLLTKDNEKIIEKIVEMSNGLSGRRIRKLILEAITYSEMVLEDPKKYFIPTLLEVAKNYNNLKDLKK
ncbi:MAG: AAA family ATPase [Candidatus Asgardarchaeia archaeon]